MSQNPDFTRVPLGDGCVVENWLKKNSAREVGLVMDKASVNRYHAMLNGKRLELQERLDAARKQKIEASLSEAKDEGDRATAALAAEMTVAQQAQTESLIKVIAAALRRIDEGTFGQCLNCGGEIGSKRLEALPWTSYCITCQELIDGNG